MSAGLGTEVEHRDPASARLDDLIPWTWASLAPALAHRPTDPRGALPFVEAGTDTFYWELHFEGQTVTRADFLQRPVLTPGRAGARTSPDPILAKLRAWYATPGTREICHPTTWLELDGPIGSTASGRQQGVSVCLDRNIGTSRSGDPLTLAHPEAHVLALFTRLHAACGTAPNGIAALARIRGAALERGGVLRHLSIMRGRLGSPAKVYVSVPKPELASFLDAAGWPGDVKAACELAQAACTDSARINLDLELGEAIAPRIGFELFFDPSPARDPYRRSATRLAAALGHISPEQVTGLESWVGDARKRLGNDAWPTRIQRWFDLKFVLRPDGGELKCYLGFRLCQGIF